MTISLQMKHCKCGKPMEFVFRFDQYDGTEAALQVYDAQVVQYKFVNQGTTICLIGNGLKLYPKFSGIEPNEITLDIRECEMDVTVFNYSFDKLDFIAKTMTIVISPDFQRNVPFIGLVEDISGAQTFNRLLVISKVKANLKGSNSYDQTKCEHCGK
jgi:hypothetical protein